MISQFVIGKFRKVPLEKVSDELGCLLEEFLHFGEISSSQQDSCHCQSDQHDHDEEKEQHGFETCVFDDVAF